MRRPGLIRWNAGAMAGAKRPRIHRYCLTGLVFLFLGSTAALAQAPDWTGTVSTDWFDANNWDEGAVPTSNDNIEINTIAPNPTVIDSTGAASRFTYIAFSDDSTGMVTVTGSDATWTTRQMEMGFRGNGMLTVEAGAQVTSDIIARVAFSSTSQGTVTVNGAGSRWSITGELMIGNAGQATLTISDGGQVSNVSAIIGRVDGKGTVTVTGPGSQWTNSGNLVVGSLGEAMLTVADQGTVSVGGGAGTVFFKDPILPSPTSGGPGTVNIGAADGEAAVAPGMINAALMDFTSPGTSTLVFNHTAGDYVFAAALTGGDMDDAVDVLAGTTTLAGDSSGFSGVTTVKGGMLVVSNALGGTINVTGGMLGGNGALGAVTIGAGATLAPGMSIGTATADTVTFDPGSIFEVEADPDGNSDLLEVTNMATLAGTVQVLSVGTFSPVAPVHDYIILTADDFGGTTFDAVTFDYAFLTPELSYDNLAGTDRVILNFIPNSTSFGDLDGTPNQEATGDALDSLGVSHPLYNLLIGLNVPDALAAYDALSGDLHPSVRSALINDSQQIRDTLLGRAGFNDNCLVDNGTANRIDQLPHRCRDVWIEGYGAWTDTDSDGNAAAMSQSNGGILAGIDGKLAERFRLGFAGGWSKGNVDIDSRNASADTESWHIAAYGGTTMGMLNLRNGVAFSWHDISTARTGLAETPTAGYDATTLQLFGEAGILLPPVQGVSFEPFAGLAHLRLHTDGFTENGGAESLAGQSDNDNVTFVTLGARLEATTAALTMRGMAGWRHAFGDTTPSTTFTLDGSDPFSIAGVPIAQNAFVATAGVEMAVNETASLGIAYAAQIASHVQSHAVEGYLTVGF